MYVIITQLSTLFWKQLLKFTLNSLSLCVSLSLFSLSLSLSSFLFICISMFISSSLLSLHLSVSLCISLVFSQSDLSIFLYPYLPFSLPLLFTHTAEFCIVSETSTQLTVLLSSASNLTLYLL